MIYKTSLDLHNATITFETGEIARQAGGSVIVRQNDAAILATVTASKYLRKDIDFFPLSVDFRELFGSAGLIPQSYGRREGRLNNREILTSRIIDRSIRPLFPKMFRNETQVIITLLSCDQNVDADVLGLLGATMALHLSDIPWNGPAAGLRVALVNGQHVINPTFDQRLKSSLDCIVSSGPDGLMMIEGEAKEIANEELLASIEFGQDALQPVFELMTSWRAEIGKPKLPVSEPEDLSDLFSQVAEIGRHQLDAALDVQGKHNRHCALEDVKMNIIDQLDLDADSVTSNISTVIDDLKSREVRRRIIQENRRLDGRDCKTIRPISGRVDWLARPHGSSLFTRGETQAFVTCTLSTLRSSLKENSVYGDQEHSFFLHYNFPPYSVGETRPMRGPGRREIGHGNLAWRALKGVMPSKTDFPYAIRLYSEITESNGSSSMATVCGGSLALMDAGVRISNPVAGIAMGLIKEIDDIKVLSDILGDEDHLGDMDFKVAGTQKGITAIQMDNKIGKLPLAILKQALDQAREGYLHILNEMAKLFEKPRRSVKPTAPQIATCKIRPTRIRDVIGPGGKTINSIREESGAEIDIGDEGVILIYANSQNSLDIATNRIKEITKEAKIGEIYAAKIVTIKPFGAFVELFPGTQGLVHVSQWDDAPDGKSLAQLNIGDTIRIKTIGVDSKGRIQLVLA